MSKPSGYRERAIENVAKELGHLHDVVFAFANSEDPNAYRAVVAREEKLLEIAEIVERMEKLKRPVTAVIAGDIRTILERS